MTKKGTTIQSLKDDMKRMLSMRFVIGNEQMQRPPKLFEDITCEELELTGEAYDSDLRYSEPGATYDGTTI